MRKSLTIGLCFLLICSLFIPLSLGYNFRLLNISNYSFTAKKHSSLQKELNKTYGGIYTDFAYSAQQTNDGGFILTGKRDWITPGNGGNI